MNTLLKEKCLERIKNKLCLVCGKELKNIDKTTINHQMFGSVEICINHSKDKGE